MAKKRTARKPTTKPTKGTGKKPAKRPLAKPTKRPLAKPTKRPLAKPTKSSVTDTAIEATARTSKQSTEPTKSPAKNTTIEAAATTSKQATQEPAKPENTWVVWQDGRGIWVGTRQEFKDSKRLDTIVCDVIASGTQQASVALHRAIQLAETVRQTYANYMKYWLQYDDAAQKQRIQEWYERLSDRGR
jgi:hypothetical protein